MTIDMASGGQRQLGRNSQTRRTEPDDVIELDEGSLSDEEQEETREALYGYIFRRAEGDSNLSREQTGSFQRARAIRLQASSEWWYVYWRIYLINSSL